MIKTGSFRQEKRTGNVFIKFITRVPKSYEVKTILLIADRADPNKTNYTVYMEKVKRIKK